MAKSTTVREAIASFEKSKGVVAADEAKVTCNCPQHVLFSHQEACGSAYEVQTQEMLLHTRTLQSQNGSLVHLTCHSSVSSRTLPAALGRSSAAVP